MSASLQPLPFAPRCLSLDLEVGRQDGRIHRFAAVRGDTGAALHFRGGNLQAALERLDDFAPGASFLLGHNLTSFDRPHLQAINPSLRLLSLPDVDTLLLNPLAFPRNPYHHLVKDYQDGQLKHGQLNDPELDARLTLELFLDQLEAVAACHASSPDLLRAWHWLTTQEEGNGGFDAFFSTVRRQPRPKPHEAAPAIRKLLEGQACTGQVEQILCEISEHGWPLAYVLAWLSVAGGNSVMPPWVRHQFPEAGEMVRRLRDTPCRSSDCTWCREHHDAVRELTRWFGFPGYRSEPAGVDGESLQQTIVEAAMRGEHVVGILPTGTGKSVCYQIPALSRYYKTGALTVVISPLVALMADQVAGMEARGLTSCAAVNGLLSWPERVDVLDRVRLGDLAILIISPEQLRNRTVRRALAQRAIGAWVLDEAHCLSKWGHDFRPDYRYVGRFIRDRPGEGRVPPVLCLTATAKVDVVADIRDHFRDRLGIDLTLYDGGANRSNLEFAVVGTSQAEKLANIHQVIEHDLPADVNGGAIVYCSSRRRSEETAHYLREKGLAADFFHAGLPPETKKDVQRRFIHGELKVIAATNAFGMGIDKPDVRLVVHADMPGSLENYLQEAGRAGRDQHPARCVLLYTPEDTEFQFSLSARSRLSPREIAAILRAVRRLDRKKRFQGEVVATPGEILLEEDEGAFERETTTGDTRVRTAVLDGAWHHRGGSDLPVATSDDPDTDRRLYYVAMTRARQTLTLANREGAPDFVGATSRSRSSFLTRPPRPLNTPPKALSQTHVRLTLRDIDLGYAGRFNPDHPVHRAIASLTPGDPLTLRDTDRDRELASASGAAVGRLARAYELPPGTTILSASVAAILCRNRSDAEAEYAHTIAADAWEVVVPELRITRR